MTGGAEKIRFQDIRRYAPWIALFFFFFTGHLLAQNSVFGKNKVQYKNFKWEYIQTDHFDIYFKFLFYS